MATTRLLPRYRKEVSSTRGSRRHREEQAKGLGRHKLSRDAEEPDSESDSEVEESETVRVSRRILEELEKRYYA